MFSIIIYGFVVWVGVITDAAKRVQHVWTCIFSGHVSQLGIPYPWHQYHLFSSCGRQKRILCRRQEKWVTRKGFRAHRSRRATRVPFIPRRTSFRLFGSLSSSDNFGISSGGETLLLHTKLAIGPQFRSFSKLARIPTARQNLPSSMPASEKNIRQFLLFQSRVDVKPRSINTQIGTHKVIKVSNPPV